MSLGEIYERVSKWNSLRYDRVLHVGLLQALLTEELDELRAAGAARVEQLDAMCDVTYVALGGVWKSNITGDELMQLADDALSWREQLTKLGLFRPRNVVRALVDRLDFEGAKQTVPFVCLCIAYCMLDEMDYLGLAPGHKFQALRIVCDSNDSKAVEVTASNVKANQSKGPYYRAPTERLKTLLEESDNASRAH